MADERLLLDDDPFAVAPRETIAGTDGFDTLEGSPRGDLIVAGGSDDIVNGRGGADLILGRAGADTLRGNKGADEIRGGLGNDVIEGNGGGDFLRGGQDDDTISGGIGGDRLRGGAGDDAIEGNGGADTIDAGSGNDLLRGGGGDDVVRGQTGDDRIEGNNGIDLLFGGAGDDELLGNDGRDTLTGGAGDDLLDGGRGRDRLEGGDGSDTFRFTSIGIAVDTVLDYAAGVDRLDLAPILPDFEAGDRLGDFVRFTIDGDDTLLAVDQDGLDGNFVDLTRLQGVRIASLAPEDLGLPEAPSSGLPTEPTLVSTNADGVVADGVGFLPSISADGRFVSFASDANNLGTDGAPGFDVFRKDLVTGEVVLAGAGSDKSAISADGSMVAFRSFGGGSTAVVDLANGGGTTLGGTDEPSITRDGRLAAFEDNAGGIARIARVADSATGNVVLSIEEVGEADPVRDTLGTSRPDIAPEGDFLAYADEGQILLRSLVDDSEIPVTDPGARATQPDLAGNARFVAFESGASLVVEDTNDAIDIYRAEIDPDGAAVLGLELVSQAASGIPGNGDSVNAAISEDGRLIAFRSFADNLVEDDVNGIADIFVKDVVTGQVQRIELNDDTSAVIPQRSFFAAPAISADGRFVTYTDQIEIQGEELVAGQVFVAPVTFAPPALDTLEAPVEVSAG